MAKCNQKTEVYSRVTGYSRPISSWNIGKQAEFADRKMYNFKKAYEATKRHRPTHPADLPAPGPEDVQAIPLAVHS